MTGRWLSGVGMVVLAFAAMVTAQPRLHLALEDRGDPRPRQMAITGEIMGQALGIVISWSTKRQQLGR